MSDSPSTTRGGCTPVIHDIDRELSHSCRRPRGGDATQGAPGYVLVVGNPDGVLDLFQDELGNVVVDDALESLVLNQ